ncbi:MAG: chromosome segregation protein SMC [Clostridia bacterium]|nr:chromosome segregation protein SMC [Clostridia bacterium]
MLLSSIQIQGFKSFADKTVLKFGKGITAVVGPNGSGKSNISDAVRWVLGEQSMKNLRGQAMENVIFDGAADRRPHGFCEVTLNIDNSDRTLNFDNDFVSITRKYYRSHESEYLINNVSVRLKDIHELFMDTGLGRDGYSMIGQGKIDEIIGSKSNERRDIFEEASGISKYRYRKTEAERKLISAEDNLSRLKDILGELESRIGPLKNQSEKAEEFLKYAEEKKNLEIGIWLHTLNNSKELLRSEESKIDAAQIAYKEIEESLSSFDEQAENNTRMFTEITAKIEEKRNEIAALNEESLKLEGDISVINNDILHNEETIKRLNDEKRELELSDKNAIDEIAKKRELAEKKSTFIDTLNKNLSNLENELSTLLLDSENISKQIEDKIIEINKITGELSDFMITLTTAKTSIEEISSRLINVDSLIEENKANTLKCEIDVKETKSLLSKTEDNINSINNTIKGYEMRLKSRSEELEKLTAESQEMHLDIEAKKRRVQILSELEKNMEGFSKSVVTLMNESSKGILRGVHGTISKIISVDKKYTVAIETALGNNIQNVVVDTEADAKRAIEYLKSNNKGRATFMPISSVRAREFKETGLKKNFGYVAMASELVRCDEKYNEIIEYLLGATVVTEDIDTAVTLAKKHNYRVKVVSLDGQVVNPGGLLTGGSLVKQAGILSRSVDIANLEKQIKNLQNDLELINKKVLDKRNQVDEINADIKASNADLITANEDRIRIIAELKRLEEIEQNNLKEKELLSEEKTNGSAKIDELKHKVSIAEKSIETLTNNKETIQREVDGMTGGRDSISDKREELANKITELKLSIIENEKDMQSLKISADELELSMGDRAQKAVEYTNQVSVINFKSEQLKNDIIKLKTDIENNKIKVGDLNKEIEKLFNDRNETEKTGAALRLSEREKTLERERIGGELARLTERKEMIIKEYDDVIRQLYDEYSLTRTEAENMGIVIEKPAEAKKQLAAIRGKIRSLGNVNVSAIEEYKEVKERYDFMSEQIADVEKSKSELHKLINELTISMKELFITGFNKINENFSKTFKDLFGGGTASLVLSDPENVLESGIDIIARLPGKNVPSLDGLSGGEKALVALSIYFAIMQVSAPPFCFLDEVDTALDDINVERFANYMKNSNYNTQFICVTHRRGTMEAADMLYGVTMQEKGVTKLLELNVSELEKKLNLQTN